MQHRNNTTSDSTAGKIGLFTASAAAQSAEYAKELLQQGIAYFNQEDYRSAKKYLHKAFTFFKHDDTGSFHCSQTASYLGTAHYNSGEYSQALIYLKQVHQNYLTQWVRAQWMLANCHQLQDDKGKANETLITLIPHLVSMIISKLESFDDDRLLLAEVRFLLGKNLSQGDNPDLGLSFLLSAKNNFAELHDMNKAACVNLELGIAYISQNQYTLAMTELQAAYNYAKSSSDTVFIADCAQYLGLCYLRKAEYKTAMEFLKIALKLYAGDDEAEEKAVEFGLALCSRAIDEKGGAETLLKSVSKYYCALQSSQKPIARKVLDLWLQSDATHNNQDLVNEFFTEEDEERKEFFDHDSNQPNTNFRIRKS